VKEGYVEIMKQHLILLKKWSKLPLLNYCWIKF